MECSLADRPWPKWVETSRGGYTSTIHNPQLERENISDSRYSQSNLQIDCNWNKCSAIRNNKPKEIRPAWRVSTHLFTRFHRLLRCGSWVVFFTRPCLHLDWVVGHPPLRSEWSGRFDKWTVMITNDVGSFAQFDVKGTQQSRSASHVCVRCRPAVCHITVGVLIIFIQWWMAKSLTNYNNDFLLSLNKTDGNDARIQIEQTIIFRTKKTPSSI